MSDVTVGLDIGTTSVKALAVDAQGEVLARARVPHDIHVPAPDRLEHDADAAWRRGHRRALAELGIDSFDAVCVAAMVPSLTAVDDAGLPTTPGLLYGDARGRVPPPGDGSAGSTAHPGASREARSFLRWTAERAPRARGYWPAQAVANHALSGAAVIDMATAGSVWPLFDGTAWDAAELAEVGARPEQLPRVVGLGEAAGQVGDAVLASGSVDALGEQAVSGATEPGDVLVVLGATLLVWVVVDGWREVDGLWSIPHPVPGRFLVGGASNAGGLFVDWVRRVTAARSAPPDPASVPVWEPYPRGERTPLHDPDRRAVLHDLDLTHDAGAILRAAHEAGGFVVRHHLDLVGTEVRRIVASGGGTASGPWVQAIADATGSPLDVVAVPEGGALGAAWVARMAAGLEDDLASATRWARTGRQVEPDHAWAEHTATRYARFRHLVAGV